MSWHQHFLETPKIQNCLFLLLASTLVKCFNLRIHRCSISMVFSLFLRTAYMLLCVQTQYVQITLWCLNFKTVHKGEIQCPPPRLRICSECIRRACFSSCSRKLSPPAPSPRLSPMKSALPWARIRNWIVLQTSRKISCKSLLSEMITFLTPNFMSRTEVG